MNSTVARGGEDNKHPSVAQVKRDRENENKQKARRARFKTLSSTSGIDSLFAEHWQRVTTDPKYSAHRADVCELRALYHYLHDRFREPASVEGHDALLDVLHVVKAALVAFDLSPQNPEMRKALSTLARQAEGGVLAQHDEHQGLVFGVVYGKVAGMGAAWQSEFVVLGREAFTGAEYCKMIRKRLKCEFELFGVEPRRRLTQQELQQLGHSKEVITSLMRNCPKDQTEDEFIDNFVRVLESSILDKRSPWRKDVASSYARASVHAKVKRVLDSFRSTHRARTVTIDKLQELADKIIVAALGAMGHPKPSSIFDWRRKMKKRKKQHRKP